MENKQFAVLISGAGQLGSRYLQGLAKCRLPLRIYVHDIYEQSLSMAQQRWNEVVSAEAPHEVFFHESYASLPRQLDVAIVATTANVRPRVVSEISGHADVRFWVLEKVLAQNEYGLDEILLHTENAVGAWVNTPRRMMPWHQQIKATLGLTTPVTLKFVGGEWGMACNAVHFLDLFAWWTNETPFEFTTDHLSQHWFEAKRQGNWEVFGTLGARFSGGSHALLTAGKSSEPAFLEMSDGNLSWIIREAEGVAKRSDGLEIPGRIAYQSEMSAGLVESILDGSRCDLPTLVESTAIHRVFIRSMLEHWKQAGNSAATFVPIT